MHETMSYKPTWIGIVIGRHTLLACLMTVFVSVSVAQEPAKTGSSEFGYRLFDALLPILEDNERFQELSDSEISNFRDEFAKAYSSFHEESKKARANDDRTLLQRQLDSLAEHAPDLHQILDSSGYEQMGPIEKYRTFVPLLREKRWGMEDSSTMVNTLDRIEEQLDSVSSTAVRGFVLRIVGQGAERLMNQYSSTLLRVASHEASKERISVVADHLPIITGDYFSCSERAQSSMNGCFAGSVQEYFEKEIVPLVKVLENYEKDKNAIKEWRRRYSIEPYDEKLEECRWSFSDDIVLCADALGEAAKKGMKEISSEVDLDTTD